MKMMYFLKVFKIMSIVSDWSVTALEDGKVTIQELTDLGVELCKVLGVKTEFDVVGELPLP